MAEVKWIKLTTDMFDNRKIKHLRKLPEGNSIVLIWVMLLTMAGRCNANGMIFLTENIPYTKKMLADELDFEENTVQLALNAFQQFGMIEIDDDDVLYISGWEEYQSTDRLAEIREYNRLAKQKSREKKKLLQSVNDNVKDKSMTSQQCQDTEEDKEKDKDKRIKNKEKEGKEKECQQVVDLYNSLCPSLNPILILSNSRTEAILEALNTYSLDDFKRCFEIAEKSYFLKGGNKRKWKASFDWLIQETNMAKVLEGNFTDAKSEFSSFDTEDFWNAALERSEEIYKKYREQSKTAGECEEVRERMETLKKQLG